MDDLRKQEKVKGGTDDSHSHSSVGRETRSMPHGIATLSNSADSGTDEMSNGFDTVGSALIRQHSGPASLGFHPSSTDVADFYCPLADSMEWIDGPESEPVVPLVKPTGQVWAERLRQPDQTIGSRKWKWKQSSSGSTRSGPAILSNGWQRGNHVTEARHGKAVRSLLGCASMQTSQPDLTQLSHSDSEYSPSDTDNLELNVIKVGNSCFYVPSSTFHVCDMDLVEVASVGSSETREPGIVPVVTRNPVKDKGKFNLPNGLSIVHTCSGIRNSLSSPSADSLDRQGMKIHDSERQESRKIKNLDEDRNSHGPVSSITQCESDSLHSDQIEESIIRPESTEHVHTLDNFEQVTRQPMEYVSAWHSNNHRRDEAGHAGHNDCSLLITNRTHSPASGDLESYVTMDRNVMASDQSMGNGVSLHVSGDNDGLVLDQTFEDNLHVHEERSPYAYGIQFTDTWSESTFSASNYGNHANNTTCDSDGASTSSYNFMDVSVARASHCKYCERSKELDKVLFAPGNCDNNEDVGDFIEADIAQRVEETSSSRGSRNSTSSNEEDNVLLCQEEKGETDFICADEDQDALRTEGLEESEASTGALHHPQEDDLGHDGVFFSYAPNQHPSSMPGMFRRDPRTCFGGASHERKLDNSFLDRHYPRQRGACRSDSSSIAKQSSSDSEISNLAFSDSSLLISPEVDMIGFDLLVSAADVDRAVQVEERRGSDVNARAPDIGSLRRNSSEEGFHEAQDDELGAYEASAAHGDGAFSCTNDLSSTSELQMTGMPVLCPSSGACSDTHGLNVNLRDAAPSPAVLEDGIDEACILTYDQTHREKSKFRNRQRKACERKDNLHLAETRELSSASACASSSKAQASEQHTNNIVDEEACACPGMRTDYSKPEASPFIRLIREEESEEEADNGTGSPEMILDHTRGGIAEAEVQSLLANILERKQLRDYYKFGDKLKGKNHEKIDKVMLWNEYEAYVLQVKQIGTSACGPTAVMNILKGLEWPVKKDDVCDAIHTNLRDETGTVPEYLFSRSMAGTTAEALMEGMTAITDGAIVSRFFHFYPPREVDLLKWLTYWMRKGAVPLATLNLQKAVKGGYSIPDAWHHQMIYGVSPKGVYLTNPMELVPEEVIMEQLASESVLLVRRYDIISRHNDNCDFLQFLQQPDSRWQTMNVLGQVVNVLREETMPKIPGYRAQVTSHITIPAIYRAGITLFLRKDADACAELLSTPELPIARSAPSTPESISC